MLWFINTKTISISDVKKLLTGKSLVSEYKTLAFANVKSCKNDIIVKTSKTKKIQEKIHDSSLKGAELKVLRLFLIL